MRLGLPGLGMAYALVNGTAALAMLLVVLRGGAGFIPDLRVRPSLALFRRILAVGLVASMLAAIANLTTILVTARIAHHGAAAVAAYGISARLEFLMIPLAFGVGSALTALVGHAVGAGDWATARRTRLDRRAYGLAGGRHCRRCGRRRRRRCSPPLFTSDPEVLRIATRALAFIGTGVRRLRPRHGALLRLDGRRTHALAGRRWRCRASASPSAAAGCWPTWPASASTGSSRPSPLGITAYGLVTALGVRRRVWS